MKKVKLYACVAALVVLRIIELPFTLISILVQAIELGYVWVAIKLAELSGSETFREFIAEACEEYNAWGYHAVGDWFEELAEDLEDV